MMKVLLFLPCFSQMKVREITYFLHNTLLIKILSPKTQSKTDDFSTDSPLGLKKQIPGKDKKQNDRMSK